MINKEQARTEALKLKNLLLKYSERYLSAKACLQELHPILQKAISYEIDLPVNHLACGKYFTDGELGEIQELLDAYSNLNITLKGYDQKEIENFFKSI